MAFDVSAGLSSAGAAVSKTAGEYLTDEHRAALETEKVKLADQLADVREEKQRSFVGGESEKERGFKAGEGILNRASEEKRTSTMAGASITAASLAAEAHKYSSNQTLEAAKTMAATHEKVANIYAGQRDEASKRSSEARTEAARIVADARKMVQSSLVPSADALETLATAYNATGTLPTMGYGGTAGKTAILDRAAEIRKAAGVSNDAWMDSANRAKFAEPAAKSLQKQYAATEAYSATAEKNADIIKELLDKGVGPTGMPIIDRWIQAGRKATGDADVAAFNAAIYAYAVENAKVMSGAMGNAPLSDAARKEVEENISKAMNREQLLGVMAVMDAERTNRMAGFQEQMTKLNDMAKGRTTAPLPHVVGATPSAPSAGQPVQLPVISTPQGSAIDPRVMKPGIPYLTPDGRTMFWDPSSQTLKNSP